MSVILWQKRVRRALALIREQIMMGIARGFRAVSLVLALVLGLAACGGSDEASPTTTTEPAAPDAEALLLDPDEVEITPIDDSATSPAEEGAISVPPEQEEAVAELEESLAAEAEVTVPDATEELRTVSSHTGRFSITVPARLDMRSSASYHNPPGKEGLYLSSWRGQASRIGVVLTPTATTGEEALAEWRNDVKNWCPDAGGSPEPYDDGRFVGVQMTITGCGSGESLTIVAVSAVDGSFTGYFTLDYKGFPEDIPAFGAAITSLTRNS